MFLFETIVFVILGVTLAMPIIAGYFQGWKKVKYRDSCKEVSKDRYES